MRPPSRIFLDVDGVLADWVGGVCNLFDLDQADLEAQWKADEWGIDSVLGNLGVTDVEMWAAIDKAGADFWASLEPLPWAHSLYELCNTYAPTTILTSPSQHPSSAAGKMAWLEDNLGPNFETPFRDFLIGSVKHTVARPGVMLIDDRPSTIEAFRNAGGEGLLFPRPWNPNREYASDPMVYVDSIFGVYDDVARVQSELRGLK